MIRSPLTLTAAAATAIVCVALPASAGVLAPGSTIAATSTAADPTLGTYVDDTGVLPFSTPGFSGDIIQIIFQEDLVANPLGGLTFVYQFFNDSSSLTSLHRFSGFDFGGFSVDASYFGSDQEPITFDRGPAGSVIGANFNGANLVDPGEFSTILVFRTNAPDYGPGTFSVIDGAAVFFDGFAPVPAPGAFALLGLAGLTAARRRRS